MTTFLEISSLAEPQGLFTGPYPITLRESISRQVDKSGGPKGERGLEFSRRKKNKVFFALNVP